MSDLQSGSAPCTLERSDNPVIALAKLKRPRGKFMSRMLHVLSLVLAVGCASSGATTGQGSSSDSDPSGPYGQATADYVRAFLGAGYLVADLINPTPGRIDSVGSEPCAINIFRQGSGLRIDFRRTFQLELGTTEAAAGEQAQSQTAWVQLSAGAGGIGGFSHVEGTSVPPVSQRLPLPAVRFFVQGERELSATRADLLRIVLKDAVVACGGRLTNS